MIHFKKDINNMENPNITKTVYSKCLLRFVILRVLCCSVYFCTGHLVMVPLILTPSTLFMIFT